MTPEERAEALAAARVREVEAWDAYDAASLRKLDAARSQALAATADRIRLEGLA